MRMRLLVIPACSVLAGGLLLAGSPPPPGPGGTPSTCRPVLSHSTLMATGTIRPVTPGTAPAGSCSQITLTAWRNNFDYNCTDARTPHESTQATGKDLNNCVYALPIEMGHMVVIRATSAVPMWRVTLDYNNNSETSPAIWEETHPVTINWHLKHFGLEPASTPPHSLPHAR
jgi:hypothetical protein